MARDKTFDLVDKAMAPSMAAASEAAALPYVKAMFKEMYKIMDRSAPPTLEEAEEVREALDALTTEERFAMATALHRVENAAKTTAQCLMLNMISSGDMLKVTNPVAAQKAIKSVHQ